MQKTSAARTPLGESYSLGLLLEEYARPAAIAYAQRLVTLTDWIFTAGGVALILVGAYGMAAVAGLDLRGTTWLLCRRLTEFLRRCFQF
jgi:uncharacterized membrane protein